MKAIYRTLFLLFILLSTSYGFSQTEGSIIEGELIVQLKAATSVQAFEQQAILEGFQLKQILSKRMGIVLLQFDFQRNESDMMLQKVKSIPAVLQAQHNHIIALREIAETTPNDPSFNLQWNLHNTGQNGGFVGADVDALRAWDITTGGQTIYGDTIVVAVVDGGCYLPHEDLNLHKNRNEIAGNGIDDDGNGYIDDYDGWNAYLSNGIIPSHQHGTHVTGIVSAIGNNGIGVSGINWNTKVLPVAGSSSSEATVVAAYAYIYEMRYLYNTTNGTKGAFIVATNSSFGVDYGQPANYPIWGALYDSMGTLGIVNAVATANLNINVDELGDVPSTFTSPWLIGITNTTNLDGKNVGAAFGPVSIDLGAPGTNIYSTRNNNTYGTSTGTSMASPHVAGAIALLLAAADSSFLDAYREDPARLALQLKQFALAGIDPVPGLQNKTLTGGRLNAYQAILRLQNRPALDIQTDTLFVSLLPNSQTNISLLTANTGQDSLSVIFYPEQPENWFSLSGNEFKIAGSESVELPILINSSGLSNGNYLAAIIADAGIFGLKRIVIQLIVGDQVGILSAENELMALNVFPNPFKNNIQFELISIHKGESINLQIFDSRGLLLFETTFEAINNPYVKHWNGEKYPKGMYFYMLQSAQSVLSGRLLKF